MLDLQTSFLTFVNITFSLKLVNLQIILRNSTFIASRLNLTEVVSPLSDRPMSIITIFSNFLVCFSVRSYINQCPSLTVAS